MWLHILYHHLAWVHISKNTSIRNNSYCMYNSIIDSIQPYCFWYFTWILMLVTWQKLITDSLLKASVQWWRRVCETHWLVNMISEEINIAWMNCYFGSPWEWNDSNYFHAVQRSFEVSRGQCLKPINTLAQEVKRSKSCLNFKLGM